MTLRIRENGKCLLGAFLFAPVISLEGLIRTQKLLSIYQFWFVSLLRFQSEASKYTCLPVYQNSRDGRLFNSKVFICKNLNSCFTSGN